MSNLTLGSSFILNSDYSTTETKTGARWVDGKPIYRKVYNINSFTTAASTVYAYNITDLPSNIETMVDMRGFAHNGGGWQNNIPFVYIYPNSGLGAAWFIRPCYFPGQRIEIDIMTGANATTIKGGSLIIEYTKTTD